MDLATFEQKQGRITHFEYRNQDILWSFFDGAIDLREIVTTWYLVKTTKTKSGLVSLQVATSKERDEQRPIIELGYFDEWDKTPLSQVPSWLSKGNPPIERHNCPTTKDSLKVKAP
jgi:hypothetical protein